MRVGFIGLGKLGLPVATAMAARGLEVYGYDPREPDVNGAHRHEEGFSEAWREGRDRLHFCSLQEVIANCEVAFLAVQTPHEPRFEGVTPLSDDRADFDYSHLKQAVGQVVEEVERQERSLTLAVISTVLPGTMAREVQPLLSGRISLAYNPSFIAMGTTIRDFLDPEFVLMGSEDHRRLHGPTSLAIVYGALGLGERIHATSIPNAELAKVAYNTFIGLKIAFANTLMEVCHKTDCDVDEVTGALKLAHRRLISGAYLDGGMGDGGGCHPRDNIALSWLARELNLSHDLFEDAMLAREHQTHWLVDLVLDKCRERGLPPAILGVAYKPSSHITTGSPARLAFAQMMRESFVLHGGCALIDPHVDEPIVRREQPTEAAVFLIGCRHPEFAEWALPEGSVVIDPWRYIPDREGVEVIRVGQGLSSPAYNRTA